MKNKYVLILSFVLILGTLFSGCVASYPAYRPYPVYPAYRPYPVYPVYRGYYHSYGHAYYGHYNRW